ncbi:MAG: flagellar biosynthesis protein FlhB [Geminicoccaceae bacterium]|nr:flagellar biosynthesis protein FlhB [Geminicoccaceae bacterium]
MADEQDDSQKTEEPTQKRLDDARQKGQVVTSREVANMMMLGTATLLCVITVPSAMHDLALVLDDYLRDAARIPTDGAGLGGVLRDVLGETAWIMAVPMFAFMAAAVAAAAVQNGIVWTTQPMAPKFDKISPLAGLKRLFALKSLVEFVKNLFKISAIAVLATVVLWSDRTRLMVTGRLEPMQAMAYLHDLSVWVLAAITAALTLLAGFDYAYQHFEHHKQMRMSRKDVQDEHKQSDGDPMIKQRVRQLRMQRARSRMMAEVPKATVVVTNPTHVSVALRYEQGLDGAPRVVAKGVDLVALRIRELATAHGVPLVENPPVARALNKDVEIGQTIPAAHYQAVAEIIGYVMRLRRNGRD